jgi:hypothetical protein
MGCWLFSEPTLTSKVTFLKFNQAKSSINVCSTIGLRIMSVLRISRLMKRMARFGLLRILEEFQLLQIKGWGKTGGNLTRRQQFQMHYA